MFLGPLQSEVEKTVPSKEKKNEAWKNLLTPTISPKVQTEKSAFRLGDAQRLHMACGRCLALACWPLRSQELNSSSPQALGTPAASWWKLPSVLAALNSSVLLPTLCNNMQQGGRVYPFISAAAIFAISCPSCYCSRLPCCFFLWAF